uniref:Bile acid:sodium symporter n=1 Tax=Tetradesmus obliquus TaxID=3088 RepID=A0A383W3M5_TETOB|eukprot:jgi/Sobl393_1/12647/SZX71614.1
MAVTSASWVPAVIAFVEKQYLPIALLSALALGAANPVPGLAAAKMHIPALATFGIFFVQGVQLRRKEAASALSAKAEIAYGLLFILLLTPLLGLLVAQLPLNPRPLALGLGLVCTVPTALACGVAFVQQLGGNVSLALLLTVSSNILGIFTMPFILPHVVAAAALGAAGSSSSSSAAMLEPLALMGQLCQTILLPTFIGASIRGLVPGAAAFIDSHKKQLSYANAALLASVPWMQISKTASQKMAVDLTGLAATAAAAIGMHALFLLVNTAACRLLQLGGPDPVKAQKVRRTLIIVGSVKTLPVAVTVLSKLGPVLGEAVVGIAMLPVVLYQLTQIVWESVMVSQWLAGDAAAAAAKQRKATE